MSNKFAKSSNFIPITNPTIKSKMKANTDTLQKQEEEKSFQYRSYGKGELAMLYIPNVQQQSAVDRFNEWIEAAPGLKERLLSTGMNPRSRHYTPAQVRLIVEVLQEP
jgi:hypothetical protein